MTYRELLLQAEIKLDHNDITLGEFEQMIAPLNREVDVLDKIRTEIEQKIEQERFARSIFRGEEKDVVKAEQCTGSIMAYNNVIKFIDKYKAERSEE